MNVFTKLGLKYLPEGVFRLLEWDEQRQPPCAINTSQGVAVAQWHKMETECLSHENESVYIYSFVFLLMSSFHWCASNSKAHCICRLVFVGNVSEKRQVSQHVPALPAWI